MRIWSLHPKYLDPAGLVALWRETLLARAVLHGQTKGYHHHPQLHRFKIVRDPHAAIDRYLQFVFDEAVERGYSFDETKFIRRRKAAPIQVNIGQVEYEWQHLRKKLAVRHPARLAEITRIVMPELHPIFAPVPGPIAEWERP